MSLSLAWQALYWMWIVSELAIVVVTRTRRGEGKLRDRGSMLILWVVIFASITVASWFAETHSAGSGPHWLRTASVAVLAVGLAIRWTAILSLGRSFSVNVAIHATQTVHKTGLFRYVRHPSYLGLMIIFVALGMRKSNWIALILVLVPPCAALLYRIHVEEQALREAFGVEYEDYSRTTKRLIPGVY